MANPSPLETLVTSFVGVSHVTRTPSGNIVKVCFEGAAGVVGLVGVNLNPQDKRYELFTDSLLKGHSRASLRGTIELLGLVNTFLGRLEVIGYADCTGQRDVLPVQSEPSRG